MRRRDEDRWSQGVNQEGGDSVSEAPKWEWQAGMLARRDLLGTQTRAPDMQEY